ncbi:hypothetical protein [Hydrogenimonas sp. SS33]|uniref:hypothetical protein n=1 Tax=Hydrogenimonas leucolamina TaxID=2954236 RepID=UPI00336BC7A2
MRILLLFSIFISSLFAATLLNENVYERDNRIDLMLSFDSPFRGNIKKIAGSNGGAIDILLTDTVLRKPFYKSFRKSFVDAVAITRSGEKEALVKIKSAHGPIAVRASKTIDGFGLRLRIVPASPAAKQETPPVPKVLQSMQHTTKQPPSAIQKPAEKRLPTLKESDTLPGWRYWTVMGILLLFLLLLWLARRKGMGNVAKGGGWLMPKGRAAAIPEEAVVRFQKPLDSANRIVLIEFGGKQYLMVVGNTNLLLDTFGRGSIQEEDDFMRTFEANKKQLDHFLKENHPDAFESFKANATKDEPL